MISEILRLKSAIKSKRPKSICDVKLVTPPGASHGGGNEIYEKNGILCGILAEDLGNRQRIFHQMTWGSHGEKKVSYHAFGAEIRAASDQDDLSYDQNLPYDEIFLSKMRHETFVDSRGLFVTITTVNEPREYRLKITVAKMRDALEDGELNRVNCMKLRYNLADSLRKWK